MNRTAILSIVLVALLAVVAGAVFALPQGQALREGLLGSGLEAGGTSVAQAATPEDSAASTPPAGYAMPGGAGARQPLNTSAGGLDPMQMPTPSGDGDDAGAEAAEEAEETPAAEAEAAEEEVKKPESDEEWIATLDEWKTQDPREIIKAKYEDLEKRKTMPWNEDDPANFIPETGRSDPLSPVRSELPDELKQRRGLETDANEILGYEFAQAASEAVDLAMAFLEVHSVVEIGVTKLVTMSLPGQRAFTVGEGSGYGLTIPGGGYLVQVSVQVLDVSADEVLVQMTGTVDGQNTISKTQVYIPRKF